ncbi:dipeptidase [Candidatus Neomarinimicrobiota bacterium]
MSRNLMFVGHSLLILVLSASPLASQSDASTEVPTEKYVEQARKILKEVPLIDGHNDAPWQYRKLVKYHLDQLDFGRDTRIAADPLQTDIPRLRQGGVGAQFWSVWVPDDAYLKSDAVQATFEQIDFVQRLAERYPDDLETALTADDILRIHRQGKIASLIGMEGGHSINNSLALLRQFYQVGARYLTITHWNSSDWADAATVPPQHNGLTPFGEEVIREMNRLGMMVDLSHVSPETMNDALDVTKAPIIFSHSSARAICNHPRNVPDEVLKRVKKNDGIVMVTFVTSYVSEAVRLYKAEEQAENARLSDLHLEDPAAVESGMKSWKTEHIQPIVPISLIADHIDHIKDIAGIEHVGIGSDFDGISTTPVGLEDVAGFPNLIAELLQRGYDEKEVQKVAGLNLLRVFREVENVAARLQRKTQPSEALIEELDIARE